MGARLRWFEPRGTWADSDHPVFRCINCGAGIIVRSRRVVRARVELIDADEWGRMEYRWGRENPLPATEVPATPSAGELVEQLRAAEGAGPGGDHLVHLIAEAAEITEDEARRMLEA